MKALLNLVRREARDARLSLIAAPLVSAALLSVIHAAVRGTAVSEAALMASAILMILWSFYFAADLFAGDLASGRLATTALLPVRATTLWAAKIAFLVLTLSGIAALVIALEFGFQFVCEPPAALAYLLDRLPAYLTWLPALLFAASAAALCSLLTEGAMAAMLLAPCLAGALWGASIPFVHGFETVGVLWRPGHLLAAFLVGAAVLLGVSFIAFSRGQRRLGSRRVRATFALASLAALLATGGAASAAEILHRAAAELTDPLVRIQFASASPDGRWLVLEAERQRRGSNICVPAVWLLELETGEHQLVSRPASLIPDRYGRLVYPWSADGSFAIRTDILLPILDRMRTLRIRPDGGRLNEEPLAESESEWAIDRDVAGWAEMQRRWRRDRRDFATTVTWKERDLSVEFTGSDIEVAPGRGIVLAPTAGSLLRNRAGALVRVDLATGAESVLVEGGVLFLQPSPDGQAVLVIGDERTHVLRVDDGAPLHAPIPRGRCYPSWVSGGVDHRAICLTGADRRLRVIDLAAGREFSVKGDGMASIFGLGELGYAVEMKNRNLVQLDCQGRFVRTLIERRER